MTEQELYPHKSKERIHSALEILKGEPGELTEVERSRVIEQEHTLARGGILTVQKDGVVRTLSHHEDVTIESDSSIDAPAAPSLEQIYFRSQPQYVFFYEYFLTEEGFEALSEVFDTAESELSSPKGVKSFLYKQDYGAADPVAVRKLMAKSRNYAQSAMAKAFVESGFTEIPDTDLPDKMMVVHDPEQLIQTLEDLRAFKGLVREAIRRYGREYDASSSEVTSPGGLNEPSQAEIEAYTAVLKLYRRRVNQLIAQHYPDAQACIEQLEDNGDLHPEVSAQAERLRDLMPHVLSVRDDEDAQLHTRKAKRLSTYNKLLYGVGDQMNQGYYSRIHPELGAIRESLDEPQGEYTFEGGKFSDVLNELPSIPTVDSATYESWIRKILAQYDVLSDYPFKPEDYNRIGYAPDMKWQVHVSPSAKASSANVRRGLITLTPTENRPLVSTSALGAVPLADHEIEHALTFIRGAQLGLALTEYMGTGDTVAHHEAAAMYMDAKSKHELFGLRRDFKAYYVAAIEAREKGGNFSDSVKAYYDALMKKEPDTDPVIAAKKAVQGCYRVYKSATSLQSRSIHVYEGKSLAYVEQSILMDELFEAGLEHLVMTGNVNVHALAELHRVGLVDARELEHDMSRPSRYIEDDIAAFLEGELSKV